MSMSAMDPIPICMTDPYPGSRRLETSNAIQPGTFGILQTGYTSVVSPNSPGEVMNFLGRILWVTVGASAANVVGIPIAAVTWIFPVVGVMALVVGLLVWSSTAPAAPLGAVPMRDRQPSPSLTRF